MKTKKKLVLTLVFVLLIAIVAACTQAPTEDQTEDQTQNQTEDEKDAQLGEDNAENKEETPPPEGAEDGGEEGPTTPEDVEDGTYEGQTDKDERGNYGIAKITIEDGKITEAEYTEYTEDDKPKSLENGYEYEAALNAMEELPEQLVEAQDIEKIDTYTGATGTTNKFKTAVKNALKEGAQ